MSTWLNENWYYLTSLGTIAIVLIFYIYARQHPEGAAMTFWRRIKYTLASGIAVMMIIMLASALISVFAPELDPIPFFMSEKVYWLEVPIFVAAWVAAPYLQGRFPISPFSRR